MGDRSSLKVLGRFGRVAGRKVDWVEVAGISTGTTGC